MSHRPSSKKRCKLEDMSELQITPVMSLFMMIIPFLLASATFIHLSVVDATVPILSSTKIEQSAEKKRILLTLNISYNGFLLKGEITAKKSNTSDSKVVSGNENEFLNTGVNINNNSDGSYNFEGLTEKLLTIKEEYPDEDTIFLMPESYIKYDIVIKTMDSARVGTISENGEDKKKILFANAVIAASTVTP